MLKQLLKKNDILYILKLINNISIIHILKYEYIIQYYLYIY